MTAFAQHGLSFPTVSAAKLDTVDQVSAQRFVREEADMSEPHEPTHDAADGPGPAGAGPGGGRIDPQGATPATESEPTPSTAPPAAESTAHLASEAPTGHMASDAPTAHMAPGGPTTQLPGGAPLPPPGGPPGHYVFVPARQPNRFGPAFGRFVRHRATHLVAAVVVGAVFGGGTVAIVDDVANHIQVNQTPREGRIGGPFGGSGRQFPGYFVGPGGQGSGN